MPKFSEITIKNQELRKYYKDNNLEPTLKYCACCKNKKQLSEFSKKFHKDSIFSVHTVCRICQKVKRDNYNGDVSDVKLSAVVNQNHKIKKLNNELKIYYTEHDIEPTHKWCSVCEQKLEVCQYTIVKRHVFGRNNSCKKCSVIRVKKYTEEHKEERKEYKKKYWELNGKQITEDRRERYFSDENYRQKIKQEDSQRRRTTKYKNSRNIRYHKRKQNDESYRSKILLRGRLRDCVTGRRPGILKKSAYAYGIDWNACVKHLGPRPNNIDNFHIDHIIPCHLFDFTNPTHPAVCFHPSNLRWCLSDENLKKGDDLIPELIRQHNLQWILDFLNISLS